MQKFQLNILRHAKPITEEHNRQSSVWHPVQSYMKYWNILGRFVYPIPWPFYVCWAKIRFLLHVSYAIWTSELETHFISYKVNFTPYLNKSVSTSLCQNEFKLRSSRSESNRRLRATCTKTAAPTWYVDAILTLLLFFF